jgi:hypothetical protein
MVEELPGFIPQVLRRDDASLLPGPIDTLITTPLMRIA